MFSIAIIKSNSKEYKKFINAAEYKVIQNNDFTLKCNLKRKFDSAQLIMINQCNFLINRPRKQNNDITNLNQKRSISTANNKLIFCNEINFTLPKGDQNFINRNEFKNKSEESVININSIKNYKIMQYNNIPQSNIKSKEKLRNSQIPINSNLQPQKSLQINSRINVLIRYLLFNVRRDYPTIFLLGELS